MDPALFASADSQLSPSGELLKVGHLGNIGRGAIKGPGFWNYDFALLRQINLGRSGRFRLQFRAEFYNLFNHANLTAPVTNLFAGPAFGQAYYGLNREFSRFGELPLETRLEESSSG